MFELYLEKPEQLSMRKTTPVQSIKDNENRVKLIYGGICGSDLRVYRGAYLWRDLRF